MTTYVSLGEDDLAIELAIIIDQSILNNNTEPENSPTVQLITSSRYYELIHSNIIQQSTLINSFDATLYNTIITLTCSLIDRILDQNQYNKLVVEFISFITDKQYQTQYQQMKLRHLINIFNLLYTIQYNSTVSNISDKSSLVLNKLNCVVLANMLQYAIDTKQQLSVYQQLKNLSDWLGTNDSIQNNTSTIDSTIRSQILLCAYQIAGNVANDNTLNQYARNNLLLDADSYLYQYLQSCSNSSESLRYAAQASLRTIQSPLQSLNMNKKQSQKSINNQSKALDPHKLLQLSSVQQLHQSTNEHRLLYELLNIVNLSNVNTYLSFYHNNKSFVEAQQIDHEFILSKLRTLTLCHLGLSHDILAIDSIKQSLQLSDTMDVESAVIDAIMCGRLDGRIDDSNNTIIIKRVVGVNLWDDSNINNTSNTTNNNNKWDILSNKLNTWKDNVSAVLQTMHQNSGNIHGNEQPEIMVED